MITIKVKRVSTFSIVAAAVLGACCIALFSFGAQEFHTYQNTSTIYVECEKSVQKLMETSSYLTNQTRLAVLTGDLAYAKDYCEEVEVTQRREQALETLREHYEGTEAFEQLQTALNHSNELVETEKYALRLAMSAAGVKDDDLPEGVRTVELTAADAALSSEAKHLLAEDLVSNSDYTNAVAQITNAVRESSNALLDQTQNAQGRASTIFADTYKKLAFIVIVFIAITLVTCAILRHLIVEPLESYGKSIRENRPFEVAGADELRVLARTYNEVFEENEERQQLIRHQAEHDPLTDLLNRGSFDRLLALYEKDGASFALILIDVDTFKQVNDGYGHAVGDKILRRVAGLLKTTFRNIDHVCRIGGDEFAVIMVQMTSGLAYTIAEKVDAMNQQLLAGEDGLPGVSLSVGIAFTDRENPGEDLFKDADSALYRTKENGRCGYTFYGEGDGGGREA